MIIEYCLLIGRLFLDVEFWPPGAWPRAGHDLIWISTWRSTYIPIFTLLSQSERFFGLSAGLYSPFGMERHMTKNSTFEKTMHPDWKRFNMHAKRTPVDFKMIQHGENAPTYILYLAEWYWRRQVGAFSPCWVETACWFVLAIHQCRTRMGEPMVNKRNVRPYCHKEFLNARPNYYSIFRSGSILIFWSGFTLGIC